MTEKCVLMMDVIEDEDLQEREEYIWERKGVDFIPSSIGLSAVEAKLRLEMGTEKMLSAILEQLKDEYDFILIDTSPALGALNINTMAAADEMIVTVNPQLLAMMGLQDFLKSVKKMFAKERKVKQETPVVFNETLKYHMTRKGISILNLANRSQRC